MLAASGHKMTAAWHVGPIEGAEFWWTLVSSPEILVFLFFMITDPRTIPAGPGGRRAYAVGVGLLATLLIAPFTTEFATKVAVLGALFIVCAARPMLVLARLDAVSRPCDSHARGGALVGAAALAGAVAFAGLVFAAGIPARPERRPRSLGADPGAPQGHGRPLGGRRADRRGDGAAIARDVVADLRIEADALRLGDLRPRGRRRHGRVARRAVAADPRAAATRSPCPRTTSRACELSLAPGPTIRDPPTVVATARRAGPGAPERSENGRAGARGRPLPHLELGGRRPARRERAAGAPVAGGALGGVSLEDVAAEVGLDFRHGAFRFGMSSDTTAMMGGGLCWLDYDSDGWLDLFVVNSYAQADMTAWEAKGGLPRSALYRNVQGTFDGRERRAGADLPLRGNGCVAADFDLDGHTDIYVTTAGYNVPTDGYDALLWNDGDGSFTEGARAAGINAPGWHAGAAVGDVNGDGLPDLFVSGYTDVNWPIPASASGFPTNHHAVRDLLYLNQGADENGRPTFREVGQTAGIEEQAARARPGRGVHGLRPRRAPRPVRGERRRPEPAVPERPAVGRRSGSASPRSRSVRPSTTRTRAWASQLPTSARTGAPTCS